MIHGMSEEIGEMAHWYLKSKQGIRGVVASQAKEQMADAFADTVIFGIQAMTALNLNAEDVIRKTLEIVLKDQDLSLDFEGWDPWTKRDESFFGDVPGSVVDTIRRNSNPYEYLTGPISMGLICPMVDIISPVEKERNGATWVLIPDVRECNMTKTSDVYTTIRQDARGLLARAGDDLHALARSLWEEDGPIKVKGALCYCNSAVGRGLPRVPGACEEYAAGLVW